MILITLVLIVTQANLLQAWDAEELEVFDVVEEVKVNFYNFMSIPQDAETSIIKSAFRRLSLELHPDKNSAENADEQFRHLVSIYEVLKDGKKRKYYDEVLINGLPNWRSAVYYYRKVRKVGLLELCLFLFGLITVGQYLVGWASYLEKKFTLEQVRGKKLKKIAATIEIPKPSFTDTLPVQIPRFLWYTILLLPGLVNLLKQKTLEKLEKFEERQEDVEEEEPMCEARPVRKRKPGFVVPEGPTFEVVHSAGQQVEETVKPQTVAVTGGLWTDDNLSELVQLINRYPGGTPNRWEIIAEMTGRSVSEITYMANKLKANGYRLTQETEPEEPAKVKRKTKGGKLEQLSPQTQSVWSQEQQKAMENALARFPKGHLDRWDRVAECVSGKNKEQCMIRYKQLVELVKKQKENQENQSAAE